MRRHTVETLVSALLGHFSIDSQTGCWNYTRNMGSKYPSASWKGRMWRVSRIAALLLLGEDIKYGDRENNVCHTCDNPRCFNPFHLVYRTSQWNTHDAMTKGRRLSTGTKKACKNGHLLTNENAFWYRKNGKQYRGCHVCALKRHYVWRNRKRAKMRGLAPLSMI